MIWRPPNGALLAAHCSTGSSSVHLAGHFCYNSAAGADTLSTRRTVRAYAISFEKIYGAAERSRQDLGNTFPPELPPLVSESLTY